MISLKQERALLESSARPTLERVDRARKSATSYQVRKLLAYLKKELFSLELDLRTWVKACGLGVERAGELFQAEIGVGLWDYAWDCRMEVAARLLIDTDFGVRQVSDMVGSPTRQAFNQYCKLWFGLSPSRFRREVRQLPPALVRSLRCALSSDFLRRLTSRELTADEAAELAEHLWAANLQQVSGRLSEEDMERLLAREIWEQRLASQPAAWFVALLGLCFTTPVLVELVERQTASRSVPEDGEEGPCKRS